MADNQQDSPSIHDLEPREKSGRETIARFQAQFRAAAYACLQILQGGGIDRVYCDYQDDFVCRETKDGRRIYHFYQVKTKSKLNHQWTRMEVLGIPRRKSPTAGQLAESIAGRLLMHTVKFKNSCGNVIFLTNVYLDDELSCVAEALEKGDFSQASIEILISKFNDAFAEGDLLAREDIESRLSRLKLVGGASYLNPHGNDFHALARDAIYKYSEIDLQHTESEEQINSLVALVERKSFCRLMSDVQESELDEAVGVGISDLLEMLSISKEAYEYLLSGGDPAVLKSASIIQRQLSRAGVEQQIIDQCTKWKVEWDAWLRDRRHVYSEYEINSLLDQVNDVRNSWASKAHKFSSLRHEVDQLWRRLQGTAFAGEVSRERLVGGVLSALVRGEAQ